MFLLRSTVAALADETTGGTLVPRLAEQFRHLYGYSPGPAEVRSWERSLPAAVKELRAAGLDTVEILVEWQLPLTSKRVDLAVLGQHPRGGPSCVLIENKQWSRADLEDPTYRMVTVDGVAGWERLHPQEQVRGYVEYLQDFNKYLSAQPAAVAGMVLLHNATSLSIASLRAPELAELAAFPMFTGDDSAAAQAFLRSRLALTPAPQVADDVLHADIGPSKQLLDHVSEEIRAGDQFTLLDEQRATFEVVLRAVERSRRGDHKQAIIVTGGPGSGKSVIAITLLAELAKRGLNIAHATGSRSFTTTLREVVGRRVRRVKEVFRYFNVFGQAEPNSLDVLLADEAHRIRETSNYRFTPAAKRSSIPQVDELLRAARVPVFLLDEHQGVRPGEIGRVAEIRAAADRNNIDVYEINLDGQFRCGGSPGYLLWVKRLLELEPGGPIPWNPDDPFKLFVVDSPERLEQVLAQRIQEGYGARMAAGFCWKWSDPTPDGTLVDDVVIGDWRRPWNLRSDRPLGGIPSSSLWATDPAGFKQIGCIYTAQGFEYDWAGVIIGPDLVRRGDRWQTNPTASADSQVRRAPNFDLLVRNVYKVLLTRGLIGCVIYATDPETRALLVELGIPPG
jgi:uncharacterized protein